MLVEVRPIDSKSWHGKVKDESFKRPNKLPALVDGDTMRYATGLSEKDATHVIHDESEEQEIEASKIALSNKAVIETAKLSTSKQADLLLIIDGILAKGRSPEFVTVKMAALIKEQPEAVLRYIGMDKEQVQLEALVLECIEKNVLQEDGHKIKYHDSILGMDTLEVVEYLKLDENQDLKLRLMQTTTTE